MRGAAENVRAEKREYQDIPNDLVSNSKGEKSGRNGNVRELDALNFKNGICTKTTEQRTEETSNWDSNLGFLCQYLSGLGSATLCTMLLDAFWYN